MGSKWRKAKLAVGLKLCVYSTDSDDSPPPQTDKFSDVALLSPSISPAIPMTPAPSSSQGSRLSKSSSRSSKKTCSICLGTMRRGDGHALFTAECSHSFHFHCIASNVKHGNQICPVCRAQWKEIPFQVPNSELPCGRARITPVDWPQNNNALMNAIQQLPPPHHHRPNSNRNIPSIFQTPEPAVFNDDESLDHQPESTERSIMFKNSSDNDFHEAIQIRAFPEVEAVPRFTCIDNFTVLIHLKAPVSIWVNNLNRNAAGNSSPRAPVDLVTVLDISGSMAGTKLALLKRAMGFVIQSLGPNDRLSVVAFSSTAHRLFPLVRMTEMGRQQALQAVNSLVANGGTNIAEGLRKGAKVMENRKEKNPVASIILLSDGQDTYTVIGSNGNPRQPNYNLLLPLSILGDGFSSAFRIPVHAFGFGIDHDASSMHSISETTGGTFSFIETEGVIQDAFAQCMGGLLSVVIKDLRASIECLHPSLRLGSLKAGSYPNRIMGDGRTAAIDVGDLYAEEERDFLISVNVPAEFFSNETSLLKVRCVYNDPLTKRMVTLEGEEVQIERPEFAGQQVVSMEVDRQRNRLQAAEAMAQARVAAEQGNLAGAVTILENCRNLLLDTVSAKSGDRLCVALDAELMEMQERMASRHVYEASGRAYILSGLSSHSWQRATARGDSTDVSSLVQSYQTPSMVQMLSRSQAATLLGGSPSSRGLARPASFFASQMKPR